MRMNRRVRGGAVVTALLAAVTTLAACSSPDETDDSSGEATQKVNLYIASSMTATPVMVAADKGLWRKHGLDVTVTVLGSGSEIVKALATGDADFGIGNPTSTVPIARAAGQNVTLAGVFQNDPNHAVSSGRLGVIGLESAGIVEGDASSLEGKSIGVMQGSSSETFLNKYLADNGMEPGDVEAQNIPVENMRTALQQGIVDAVVPWEPFTSNIGRTVDDTVFVVRGGPYGSDAAGLMATEEYLEANPEITKKMLAGILEGAQIVRTDPDAAALSVQRYITGADPQDIAEGLTYLVYDPRISPCTKLGIEAAQESLIASGSIKLDAPMPFEDIVKETLVNEVLGEHPETVSDLGALPTSEENC